MSVNIGPLSVSACLLVFMTLWVDAKMCPHGTTTSTPLTILDTSRKMRSSIEHSASNKTNRECMDAQQAASDAMHPRGTSSDSDESVASSSITQQDGPFPDDDFNFQQDTDTAHSTRAFLCPRRGPKKMIGFGLGVPLLVAGTYFLSAGNGIFSTKIPGGNGEAHTNRLEGENMNVMASANVDALQEKHIVCIKCNVQQNIVKKGGSVGTIKQSGGGRRGGGGGNAAAGALAGAGAGAAVGAIGGPVGMAVGGAVGALGGGVAGASR